MTRWPSLLILLLLLTGAATAQPLPDLAIEVAFPGLRFQRPVLITNAGDETKRLFVLEQVGRVRVFQQEADVKEAPVFLDLTDRVRSRHNEEGLLALAFHPQFKENGRFFVYYTASNPRRGVLSEFAAVDGGQRGDRNSERVLLEVAQPFGNHNGSTVIFGPDGYLYISLGDGGGAGDPVAAGQDLTQLLAKILRLDVDQQEEGLPYGIPEDNPFIDHPDARPEIWAWGLRNVWRMSFDWDTGELWAGDVGQNAWEEIDLIVKGGNYGWNLREGRHRYSGRRTSAELIDPVVEYPRRQGLSVTGGHVYRGKRLPSLVGAYLYADYVTGRIWGFRPDGGAATGHRQLLRAPVNITSFGESEERELYLCAMSGEILRFELAGSDD